MDRKQRIAIIGGGIGGLAAAHALRRKGFEITVHEAAPELREIGAGVALGANSMKALRSLGLEDQVRAIGYQREFQYLRDGITGKVIAKTQNEGSRYGAASCNIHRADFLDVLGADLPKDIIKLGARCVSVSQDDNVASAKFRDGSEIEADIIIGADGIHSAVRASLFGPDAPRFTGKVCYRFVAPIGDLADTAGGWLGPHGTIVVYLVRRGEMINVVSHHDDDNWTEESWIRECSKDEVLEVYKDWHPDLLRLFSSSDKHYKWALYDRDPLPQWTDRRITILGDAAHPMLPYLGQGAGQAIEDGVVLAAAMADQPDDLQAALQRYERSRRPRASRVVLTARARGEENHLVSRWAAVKRDQMINLRKRHMDDPQGRGATWIPDYDASSPEALVP